MNPRLLQEIALIKSNISLLEDYVLPKDVRYSNIQFRSQVENDKVNKDLLDDINKAAERAGVEVLVGTITSTHPKGKYGSKETLHTGGNAVDIPVINGKAVSEKIKDEVEKFNSELERLGYARNIEVGKDKAFLTFGFPDHDDHVHVSNRVSGESSDSDEEEESGYVGGEFKQETPKFDLEKLGKSFERFTNLFPKF
jgi:hypothetical protein